MRQLRLKIKTDNIDLQRLFRRLNFTRQSELKLNEFNKFMQKEQVKYVFDRLDADKSNTVSFRQLEDQLKRYNIPMQSAIAQMPGYTRKDSNSEDQATLKKIQKKLTDGFKALALKLEKENVALHSFFAQFDRFGDSDLKKQDFINLLRGMQFPFNENQMSYVFKVIDTDQSGTISYYQFYKFFCKVVGQPHQPFRQQQQQRRERGMTPPPQDRTPPKQRMPQSPPMPQMPFQQIQPGYMQPGMNFGQIDPMLNVPVQAMMNGMQIGGMGMPQMMGYPQNRPANNVKYNVPGFTGNGWDY